MILDLLYLIGSIAFFTLMLACVGVCDHLGEKSEELGVTVGEPVPEWVVGSDDHVVNLDAMQLQMPAGRR